MISGFGSNAGRLSLERLVDLTSAGPARIYKVAGKGRFVVGYDADLTAVDLKARRTITNGWMANKSGWPKATILRGRILMRGDDLVGAPNGRLPGRRAGQRLPADEPARR